ncbi:MAG TPA: hypothetical protein VFC82_09830 [Actinomycetaceae bacterium]|nr:hypothetical protein [Actinomycetaceae bacterium]
MLGAKGARRPTGKVLSGAAIGIGAATVLGTWVQIAGTVLVVPHLG